MTAAKDKIAFWNVNLPEDQWTAECPDYLAGVDEGDRAQLSTRDSDYHLLNWPQVTEIVRGNRLQDFKRIPSELRRYRKYIADIKDEHGSVMNFMLKERLKWSDLTPQGDAFEKSEDLKILRNDWPYGLDPRIVHLVVWVKFGFQDDPHTGDLTPAGRKLIDDFVNTTFKRHENPSHVLWFKNWAALKSVHAIEHFHVLLWDPDPALLSDLTSGDTSASTRRALAA